MTCHHIGNAIVCTQPAYRLPLADGRRIWMEWHHYCGPTFYRDRGLMRMIAEWDLDPLICKALDWFMSRGQRA